MVLLQALQATHRHEDMCRLRLLLCFRMRLQTLSCLILLQALESGSGRDSTATRRLNIRSDRASASATLSTLGRTSQRGELTASSAAGTLRARKSATQEEALVNVLNDMRTANPPVPFAHNYLLLSDRAHGGQGIVQVRARAHMSHEAMTHTFSGCQRSLLVVGGARQRLSRYFTTLSAVHLSVCAQ